MFSRDERKQEELRLKLNNKKIKFVIGDVEDSSIHQAMNNVDYVFHAAALKQVPSCDFYPYEAVKTNIIGTENTLNAAIENNVKNFTFKYKWLFIQLILWVYQKLWLKELFKQSLEIYLQKVLYALQDMVM